MAKKQWKVSQPETQVKSTTLEEWRDMNPVLAKGELGFVEESRKFIVGDGTSDFDALYALADVEVLPAPEVVSEDDPDNNTTVPNAGQIIYIDETKSIIIGDGVLTIVQLIEDLDNGPVVIESKTRAAWEADNRILPTGLVVHVSVVEKILVGNGILTVIELLDRALIASPPPPPPVIPQVPSTQLPTTPVLAVGQVIYVPDVQVYVVGDGTKGAKDKLGDKTKYIEATDVNQIRVMTQAQYTALTPKVAKTLYFILEA